MKLNVLSERPERVRERVQSIRQKVPFKKIEDLQAFAKQRPYALAAIRTQILFDMASMLEDMSENIAQLRSEWNATIPKGKVEPIELLIQGQTLTVITDENYKTMPWMTADVFNDGPNDVYVITNEDYIQTTRTAALHIRDHLQIDMKQRKIKQLILFCNAGETATVRIYAKS